ncbi:hypothetical protein M231_08061, partial [Tremella mesenterica]
MPRHPKQNPNTLRNVPYVAPQARNAVDETMSLQQYKHQENTIKQYKSRQKKWFKWVVSKPRLTEATVTPQLALLFLYEVVLVSKTHKQSKVVSSTGENELPLEDDDLEAIDTTSGDETIEWATDEDQLILNEAQVDLDQLLLSTAGSSSREHSGPKSGLYYQLLSKSVLTIQGLSIILKCQVTGGTVHAWVATLVNLWEQQVERGINGWSSPRSVHTATIILVLQKSNERRKKLLHEDKGKRQLEQSFAHYMERNIKEGLRDALAQATGTFAFMHNKNPQICPVFLLASYLFARLYLEQGGTSPDEIARAGHWAHSVIEIHYLTHVPRRTLQAHAGFPIEGNGFFLPRAVTPPATLLKKIFPEAEKWLSLMNAAERLQEELTGRMFLQTIISLQEVFLQDVPHLRKAYPSLYIFNHPLFADKEYLRYEGHALTCTITNEKQYDNRIAQALPILHDLLQTQTRAQQQLFQDILGNVFQLSQGQMEQQEQMKAVSDGVMLIQTALNRPLIIPGPLQALLAEISGGSSQPLNISDNHLVPSTKSSSSLSITLQATSNVSLPYLQDPLQTTIRTPFTMNCTVCTVQELWQEYTLGNNGRPSIQ